MADIFARIRGRAASVITKFGGFVTFRGAAIPAIEDPVTHVWSDPIPAPEFTGNGIQTKGPPEGIEISADLILLNPIVILVAAQGLAGTPVPGMKMIWSGTEYTIKQVQMVAPNDSRNPIYYVVVGVV